MRSCLSMIDKKGESIRFWNALTSLIFRTLGTVALKRLAPASIFLGSGTLFEIGLSSFWKIHRCTCNTFRKSRMLRLNCVIISRRSTSLILHSFFLIFEPSITGAVDRSNNESLGVERSLRICKKIGQY